MYLNWQAANFDTNSTSLPYKLTTSVSTQKQQILQQNKASISCKQLDTTLLQFTHAQLQCHFTTVSREHFTITSLQYKHGSLQYNHSSLQAIALTESPTQWHTTVNRHLHSVCSSPARIGTRLDNGWTYTNVPQDQSASLPLKGTTTGSLVSALW